MTLNEKYEQIVNSNTELLDKVLNYILNIFKLNKEDLLSNTRYYILQLILNINRDVVKKIRLRERRQEKMDDLKAMKESLISSPMTESIGEGHSNGGKENHIENKQYLIAETRVEIRKLLVDCLLIEKSLEEKTKTITEFISLLPQSQYSAVMQLSYIENMPVNEISTKLNYAYDSIYSAKKRGIAALAIILKNYLKKNEK